MNNFGKVLVTGCAGFIGSNLVDRLLQMGLTVVGVDNFSTGQMQFLTEAKKNEKFKLIQIDLLDSDALIKVIVDIDLVFHLAANADVRFGVDHPKKDLEQNTIATYNVLEAMRINRVKNIVFSSTGSVYGEAEVIPTPENGPFPIQTSLYGASKAACEGLISAYCESFGMKAWIFRFVSILGERYTHGHVFDFYRQLISDSNNLKVLGDGKQKKSYLYIQDCINAIFIALSKTFDKINIFNLGVDNYCEVKESIKWISAEMNVNPHLHFSGGDRGWVGDNPFIFLDTKKIQALGWQPQFSIQEGIVKTVNYLRDNEWVFRTREDV